MSANASSVGLRVRREMSIEQGDALNSMIIGGLRSRLGGKVDGRSIERLLRKGGNLLLDPLANLIVELCTPRLKMGEAQCSDFYIPDIDGYFKDHRLAWTFEEIRYN